MNISERLLAIANLIHPGSNVIDVGADHGLLEKYLIESGKVESIFAVENKKGPFEILKNNLKDYDVNISLSDGLDEMPPETNVIVLAGMGGNLILDILKKDVNKLNGIEQIVVDAHRDAELVRREIIKLGYRIEKEKIVVENKIYYFIISFVKGKSAYKDVELEWGYNVSNDPLFREFKMKELRRLVNTLAHQKQAKKSKPECIERIQSKIERLENL
ncbi:MAG: class I SAM-dependent methyltransferase [Bacilli bacterium]|nr:class I SAM-dependent methyltransferase [Bacilli bacterium]